MNNGWLKLHRQLKESSFYGQPIPVAIWVECLFRASHESKERFIGREKVYLGAGEFVMGYREFASVVGCGVATVKTWLDVFEKEGMVERSRNAKGTICKLKKWSEYQDTRTETERSRNADGTLTEPNKNDKKVKNEKKRESADALTPAQEAREFFTNSDSREHLIVAIVARGMEEGQARAEVRKFCNYWTERTKSGTKQRWETQATFEVRRRLSTWLNRVSTYSPRSHE